MGWGLGVGSPALSTALQGRPSCPSSGRLLSAPGTEVSVRDPEAEKRPAGSPQDAVSMKAEPSYRGPVSEPEPVYSREATDYREAGGQQGLAYTPEAVYTSTEAPGHYPEGKAAARSGRAPAAPALTPCPLFSEENTYDEYENDLGITAIALYDYQAGEDPRWPTCPGFPVAQPLVSEEPRFRALLQFLKVI